MNIQEFNEKRTEYGIEGTGIDCKTKKELTWSHKETKVRTFAIPASVQVHLWFSPKKYPNSMFIQYGDEVKNSRAFNGFDKFTGLKKAPTMQTLQKRSWDGISKSITGRKVEPDGFGPDGAPSWELVMSLI